MELFHKHLILGVRDNPFLEWEAYRLSDYFGIGKSDLIEEKSDQAIELTKKDEKDIAKRLEQTLDQLESDQDGLMFSGEPLDDETRELLKASLQNSITIAKINAKQKFTPKKYRK